MSRQMKFRAWDMHRKVMSRVDYIDFVDGVVGLFNALDGDYEQPIHRVKLLQYTGLKDKNGVEIYEGDILPTFIGNAQVCIGKFNYEYTGDFDDEETIIPLCGVFLICNGFRFEFDTSGKYEVIGNIYESNHLLQEEEK